MSGDTPQPGYYKRKLVKGGPFVAVKVWMNEPDVDAAGDLMDDEGLMMLIEGERVNPDDNWSWCMGNAIDKAEYDFMCADSDHAKQYRPDDVKANPRKPIDLANAKPIF